MYSKQPKAYRSTQEPYQPPDYFPALQIMLRLSQIIFSSFQIQTQFATIKNQSELSQPTLIIRFIFHKKLIYLESRTELLYTIEVCGLLDLIICLTSLHPQRKNKNLRGILCNTVIKVSLLCIFIERTL